MPAAPSPAETTATGLRLGRPRDWLIGSALLIALILVVDRTIGWGPLLAPWLTISPWLLLTAFSLSTLSYVLRALRVYDYFAPEAVPAFRGHFSAVLRLTFLHNSANNLLPMRAGELVFPWLMRRYFGHGFMAAGASLVWIRLLDLHCLGLLGLLILWLREPRWLWVFLALLWLAALPLTALVRHLRTPRDGSLGRLRRLVGFIAEAGPGDGKRIARIYLWTAIVWGLKFTAFAVILHHFVPVDFWLVMAGVMGAELSTVLPFHGVAGSGSYEVATMAALVPLGVPAEQALAGAVNLHLFLLGTTLILGLLAFLIPLRTPR